MQFLIASKGVLFNPLAITQQKVIDYKLILLTIVSRQVHSTLLIPIVKSYFVDSLIIDYQIKVMSDSEASVQYEHQDEEWVIIYENFSLLL